MGRDILSFSEPTPERRLGLGDLAELNRRQPSDHADAPRPVRNQEPSTDRALEPPPVVGSEPSNRGRLYVIVTAVALLAAGALGYFFWSTAGRVDLRYNGQEIANADEMLAEAETLMAETAAVDGADLSPDARCFFAPENPPTNTNPMVVCGPVWLGVSPTDQPWLTARARYDLEDDRAIGRFEGFGGTANLDLRSLDRPDGTRPAAPGAPAYPATGPRLRDGRLLVDVDEILDGALAAFTEHVATNEDPLISAHPEATCFLVQGPDLAQNQATLLETRNDVWCGPGRTVTTGSSQVWLPININYQRGATFGSARLEEASVGFLGFQGVPDDVALVRPDDASPPDAAELNRPPVPVDFATVVDYPVDLDGLAGGEGLLVTSDYRINFDALVRTDQVGSGARSFTAPDGHDLVVAVVSSPSRFLNPRGTLAIDGVEQALPRWDDGDEGATMVLAVPQSARSVKMTVEDNGRPQTISLLDGSLADGYPLAFYRSEADLSRPFSVRVEMPVGEAVLVSGQLTTARWFATDQANEWLPVDTSELVFNFEGWDVDRPFTEVRIDDVVTTFTLELPAPSAELDDEVEPTGRAATTVDDLREDPTRQPDREGPRFRVPATTSSGVLRMDIEVTFTADGEQQTATVEERFEVVLP